MKMRHFILFLIPLMCGCVFEDEPYAPIFPVGEVEGYRPIYSTDERVQIKYISDQPLQNPGKIYIYNGYLLVNERWKGVHIIDNSDPKNPEKLGFIRITGNVDIALKGATLYADHGNDLVAIDISNISNPKVADRKENVYDHNVPLPPEQGVYFECVDGARANLIIGWEKVKLNNPECYR